MEGAIRGEGACTSALTIDEMLWGIVKKGLGREAASQVARRLLQTPTEVLAVERRDVEAALSHFDDGLDPRDAIHAAVAVRRGCTAIVSSDPAFGRVARIKHVRLG